MTENKKDIDLFKIFPEEKTLPGQINMFEMELQDDNTKVVEWCSNCGQEVVLLNLKYKWQKCPNCGADIKACSLCDMDKVSCKDC